MKKHMQKTGDIAILIACSMIIGSFIAFAASIVAGEYKMPHFSIGSAISWITSSPWQPCRVSGSFLLAA